MAYAENPRVVNPRGRHRRQHQQQDSRPTRFRAIVSFRWGDTQRVQRWQAADAGEREVHTRDSFIEAQLDTVLHRPRARCCR
jgi:penicillin amidase